MSEHKKHLAALCSGYSLKILYAFGSRAKEAMAWIESQEPYMASSESDLDIGILPGEVYLNARKKAELCIDLEDLFGVNRVDLVLLPDAQPFLASRIVQGERLYATNEDEADEFDLYMLARACDLMPFHKQRVETILGGNR